MTYKKQTPIEKLFTSETDVRIPRILKIFGGLDIDSVEKLVMNYAGDEITCYRGIGKGTLDYINQQLKNKYGLKLRNHIPEKVIIKVIKGGHIGKTIKEVDLDYYNYNWLQGEGLNTNINLGQLIEILEGDSKPVGLGEVRIDSIRKTLKNL